MDGIKGIFIPDKEYIETAFNDFLEDMKLKFGFGTTFFTDLFTSEKPVEDIQRSYTISGLGTFTVPFLKVDYLVRGVAYFRPIIRGWLVLMMMLYHIRQLIGFFGYDAGVVQGRSDWVSYNKTNTGGHKE